MNKIVDGINRRYDQKHYQNVDITSTKNSANQKDEMLEPLMIIGIFTTLMARGMMKEWKMKEIITDLVTRLVCILVCPVWYIYYCVVRLKGTDVMTQIAAIVFAPLVVMLMIMVFIFSSHTSIMKLYNGE